MKQHYFRLFILFFFLFISSSSFAQNDCGNNADFELGIKAGWIGKYGVYGASVWSDTCPAPNDCPTFPSNYTNTGFLNPGGNDALGSTFNGDRHTIMTKNYRWWGGPGVTGMDSISNNKVPVVNPNGGNYSLRLGDEVALGVGAHPNRYARAEAIRLSFTPSATNSVFYYSYAVFLADPGHLMAEQPRFEVLFLNDKDSLLPNGYSKFVAGKNQYCILARDSGSYKFGVGPWRYTDWTDACKDLTAYIGQTISIEFRTSDCFPSNSAQNTVVYNIGGVTTTCFDGHCCWGSPQFCTTISSCTHSPGSHSAYAYIDAYCMPSTSICNTGIKEIKDQNSIRIYPNPFNSSSVLELSSEVINAEIIISDVVGKELFRKRFSGMKTEIKKDDLDAEIYFVRVIDGQRQFTQKIMIE